MRWYRTEQVRHGQVLFPRSSGSGDRSWNAEIAVMTLGEIVRRALSATGEPAERSGHRLATKLWMPEEVPSQLVFHQTRDPEGDGAAMVS